ncbi:uncharacterized protein LOC112149036 [Oryzias melastigma]|uniref:uncharacterized protein LOC112149036 n=1 Tax=Oryzias melastigma TaxID=30732 RepID=UPI00168D547D|nr:uncharacterized protein LOC112149036 [Oryzias melastigma]
MEKVDDREPRGTQRESEVTYDEVVPELIFALVGDSNSVEKEKRNLLFDHDEQKSEKQISTKMYDLCGRHICVLNMLDLPNIDSIPSNQEVHAFILLVANGQHSSHYRSGMQWLEKTFGKQCFPYVITVVTHNPHENCENVVTDLKTFSSFSEKRYYTSKRIKDEKELITMLEKINVMVSENKPPCCSFVTTDMNKERKEKMEQKSLSEEGVTTDSFKVDTGGSTEKGDPVKKDDEAENSKKTDDNTVEQPEEQSVAGDADDKDSFNVDSSGNEGEGYPVKKDDELSKKTDKTVEQAEETSAPVDPDDKGFSDVDRSGNTKEVR